MLLFAFSIALQAAAVAAQAADASAGETAEQRYIIAIERIWDRAGHSAFTDILLVGDDLYCAFREGSGHIPGLNGLIRVLRSRDRKHWESVALLEERHVDLRDPKLSLAPDGRIVLNMGASYYHGTKRLAIESRVAFGSPDGGHFGRPEKVVLPPAIATKFDWLWRITWHEGFAWACVQQVSADRGGPRALQLVRSRDAIHYDHVATLDVELPSETTLRFLDDGTLLAMIRCESKPPLGRIGIAKPPYTAWTITPSNKRFGGPNFIELPGGSWLAGSRDYSGAKPLAALWRFDRESKQFTDFLTLPSGGDCSYPGFAVDAKQNKVYVSYYSSHEGRAAIYLAMLRLDAITEPTAATQSFSK